MKKDAILSLLLFNFVLFPTFTSFTFKNHDKVDQRDTNSLKQNKPAKGGVTIPLIAHKQQQSQQAHGYSETNEDYHHRLEHRIWLFHRYRYTTQKHCSLNWHVDNYNTASSATVSTTAQEDRGLTRCDSGTPFTPVIWSWAMRWYSCPHSHAIAVWRIYTCHCMICMVFG